MRLLAVLFILCVWSGAGFAASDAYAVKDAFVRATPAKVSAGYVILHNATKKDDALIAADASWAKRIELHTITTDAKGVMQMKAVKEMPLPAQGDLALRPNAYHLMIFGVTEHLKENETRPITLHFQSGKTQIVSFIVRPLAYGGYMKHGAMTH